MRAGLFILGIADVVGRAARPAPLLDAQLHRLGEVAETATVQKMELFGCSP
jgi:hypothetical protein